MSGKDQPFVTPDGKALWFTGQSTLGSPGPACFRSLWTGTAWGTPVEIVSQFAGEPNLDANGNLYFVHHYVTGNMSLIEADIHVAYHKGSASTSSASVSGSAHWPGLFQAAAPTTRSDSRARLMNAGGSAAAASVHS